jgi:hypothetical protein
MKPGIRAVRMGRYSVSVSASEAFTVHRSALIVPSFSALLAFWAFFLSPLSRRILLPEPASLKNL